MLYPADVIQNTRTTCHFEKGNIGHLLVKTEIFVKRQFCPRYFLVVSSDYIYIFFFYFYLFIYFSLNRPDLLICLVVILSCVVLRMILKTVTLYLIVLGQIQNQLLKKKCLIPRENFCFLNEFCFVTKCLKSITNFCLPFRVWEAVCALSC